MKFNRKLSEKLSLFLRICPAGAETHCVWVGALLKAVKKRIVSALLPCWCVCLNTAMGPQ